MKLTSRLFACRKIMLGAVSFLSLASIAAAETPYANPFERSAFGDDWGILSNDVFFGGASNLFGLSPASRTLLLTETTASATSESNAIVNAAGSSENLFSFASFLGSRSVRSSGRITAPNAPTAVITWDANGAAGANAWLTAANWDPNTVPGSADTATFATTAGSNSITINFGPGTNNGVANQIVGAIALTGGESKSISSSTATAGTLTINGVGGVLLSNSSIFDLTLQNGSLSAMTVALPNSGSIDVTSTGSIIISSSVTGAAGITKTGTGTLILSGSNLYSGGTTVSGGTLLVNNTGGSGTGSGVINVNSGGTLGGTGTILAGSNNVTIDSGGTITGATNGSVGSLTLSANTLSISGTFLADISGLSADSLVLMGNLIIAGSTLDFNTLATPTAPIYNLLSYTGTISGTFTAVDTPMGYEVQYNPGSIDLVLVPEPSTWIGAALALAAIGFTQRRRLRGLSDRNA